MKEFTVKDIIKVINGKDFNCESVMDKELTGVRIDSRKIEKDNVFIATVGERVDGHSFVKEVIEEKEAVCAITQKQMPDADYPYIVVEDSFLALKQIAEYYRGLIKAKIVGITGSVGKTSTKEAIFSVVNEAFKATKTIGNLNNQVGLPLSVLEIKEDTEVAVIEMGISEFGEMTNLAKIARPDIQVITNIGNCHLEVLGDRDGVLKAKTEGFPYLQEGAPIILNGDDDKLITIKDVNGVRPYFYGINDDFAISAKDISYDMESVSFKMFISDEIKAMKGFDNNSSNNSEELDVNINIGGEHMVYNAMAAAAVGKCLGMSDEDIVKGLSKLKTISGRNNIINTSKWTIIDDCYNANPMSMKASVDVLSKAKGRRVAILGDMYELGKNEKEIHKEIGEYLSGKVDVLICIGSLGREIYNGAIPEMEDLKMIGYFFDTVEEALEEEKDLDDTKDLKAIHKNIIGILKENDTVLVKASHGLHLEKIVEALK